MKYRIPAFFAVLIFLFVGVFSVCAGAASTTLSSGGVTVTGNFSQATELSVTEDKDAKKDETDILLSGETLVAAYKVTFTQNGEKVTAAEPVAISVKAPKTLRKHIYTICVYSDEAPKTRWFYEGDSAAQNKKIERDGNTLSFAGDTGVYRILVIDGGEAPLTLSGLVSILGWCVVAFGVLLLIPVVHHNRVKSKRALSARQNREIRRAGRETRRYVRKEEGAKAGRIAGREAKKVARAKAKAENRAYRRRRKDGTAYIPPYNNEL